MRRHAGWGVLLAWVLWLHSEARLSSDLARTWEWWSLEDATEREADCRRMARERGQARYNFTLGMAKFGFLKHVEPAPDGLWYISTDKEGVIQSMSEVFRCFPDTIDPRKVDPSKPKS